MNCWIQKLRQTISVIKHFFEEIFEPKTSVSLASKRFLPLFMGCNFSILDGFKIIVSSSLKVPGLNSTFLEVILIMATGDLKAN